MKFKSIGVCLTSLLLVGTCATAIAQDTVSVKNLKTNLSAVSAHATDLNRVMAVIDGKNITAGQLDEMAAYIDPNLAKMPDQERRIAVLRIYVGMQTVSHAAITLGLDKTADYQSRMALMRDNVLQQLYFQTQILDKITDADIKARYDQEVKALPKEEEVHARHILVKTKKEAEALIKQLDKGEKFDVLAKKMSTDGSAAVGGDLGYFSHGQMVKSFEDAAFALKVGKYTEKPVESPFGWHIIKLEDRRQKRPPELEDVQDALRQMIARDRSQEVLAQLQKNIDVQYPDPQVEKMMKQSSSNPLMPEDDQTEDTE